MIGITHNKLSQQFHEGLAKLYEAESKALHLDPVRFKGKADMERELLRLSSTHKQLAKIAKNERRNRAAWFSVEVK